MKISPKVREFLCLTAHPEGCQKNVENQITYVKKHSEVKNGPKKVLIIGASTGYGLASRINAAFGCGAATIGVMFERQAAGKRTATAGWYNTAAFEHAAANEDLYAKTVNGDAFSKEVKDQVIDLIANGINNIHIYSMNKPEIAAAIMTNLSEIIK